MIIRVRRLVEERCDKREFEHERNITKMIKCCVGLCLCSLRVYTCAMHENYVDVLVESGWYHSRRVRKGKSNEKRKEGKKLFEGKEHLFAFL